MNPNRDLRTICVLALALVALTLKLAIAYNTIGTNDAANIAAGGAQGAEQRIASMMSVIGTDPVLWIDASTIADTGYWASPNMVGWDATLSATAAKSIEGGANVMPNSAALRS